MLHVEHFRFDALLRDVLQDDRTGDAAFGGREGEGGADGAGADDGKLCRLNW